MAATASGSNDGSYLKYLAESLKRFSRSIELCDDYLRGYYGLKLVSCSSRSHPTGKGEGEMALLLFPFFFICLTAAAGDHAYPEGWLKTIQANRSGWLCIAGQGGC